MRATIIFRTSRQIAAGYRHADEVILMGRRECRAASVLSQPTRRTLMVVSGLPCGERRVQAAPSAGAPQIKQSSHVVARRPTQAGQPADTCRLAAAASVRRLANWTRELGSRTLSQWNSARNPARKVTLSHTHASSDACIAGPSSGLYSDTNRPFWVSFRPRSSRNPRLLQAAANVQPARLALPTVPASANPVPLRGVGWYRLRARVTHAAACRGEAVKPPAMAAYVPGRVLTRRPPAAAQWRQALAANISGRSNRSQPSVVIETDLGR